VSYAKGRLGKVGLPPGGQLVVTVLATAPTAPATVKFPVAGLGGGAFKVPGGFPSISVLAHPPVALVFDSATDNADPPAPNPVADKPFTVRVHFVDASGQPASPPSGTAVTLAKDAGFTGTLGGTTTAFVGSSATFDAVTYSEALTQLGLTSSAPGVTSASFTTDVIFAGTTQTLTPGQDADLQLPDAGAQAFLPNGASGVVSLALTPCSIDLDEHCGNGSQLELIGNFKDGETPLYSFGDPATLVRICDASLCPHHGPGGEPESEPPGLYDYNYSCLPAGICDDGEREVEEDFNNNPTYVSLRLPGGSFTAFTLADRCVDQTDLTTTGHILTEAAQAAGFCVDVNAITRSDDSFAGDLSIPVRFVEDPRMRA
jgi:hypothetical protein